MIGKIKSALLKIHQDQRGDVPVGTLLMVALIVIPILFLLIAFREDIVAYFETESDAVMESGSATNRPGQ